MLEKFSEKNRKIIGLLGVFVVLSSWTLPVIGQLYYDVPALETGFNLTVFWVVAWSINVLRKKYL